MVLCRLSLFSALAGCLSGRWSATCGTPACRPASPAMSTHCRLWQRALLCRPRDGGGHGAEVGALLWGCVCLCWGQEAAAGLAWSVTSAPPASWSAGHIEHTQAAAAYTAGVRGVQLHACSAAFMGSHSAALHAFFTPTSPFSLLFRPRPALCSKLDAMATEYNHLLVTQLESQRQYFEGLLVRQRAEAEAEAEAASSVAAAAAVDTAAARAAAAESERRRRQADSKLVSCLLPLQRDGAVQQQLLAQGVSPAATMPGLARLGWQGFLYPAVELLCAVVLSRLLSACRLTLPGGCRGPKRSVCS